MDDLGTTTLWHEAAAGSDSALERLSATGLRIERSPSGALIVMNPTKPFTGKQNSRLCAQLTAWADSDGTGEAYDSSTGWTLPGIGSVRSPDASWLRKARWDALPADKREGFSEICPDFVIELLSDPKERRDTQSKMSEYMAAGATLGWLIDPFAREVHVYRAGWPVQVLTNPTMVPGDPDVLPGFTLSLQRIWE